MWRLGLVFVDIALHRRGPQDVPASQFLLGLVLATYFVIGLVALQLSMGLPLAAVLLLVDSAVYLAAIWLVVKLFNRPRRFLQTATALVGTETFLNLIGLPLLLWDETLQAPAEEATPPRLLFLLLILWAVDIGGYVLSKALDRPYVVGVAIVIVYVLASVALRDALFPAIG